MGVAAVTIFGYLLVAASLSVSAWLGLSRVHRRSRLRDRLRAPVEHRAGSGEDQTLLAYLLPTVTIRRLRRSFEERRQATLLPISWSAFVAASLLLMILGFGVGTFYFHNVLAAVGLGLMGLLLPDQILATGASAHRDKTHEQLQLAINTFAAEYRASNQVHIAFLQTARQLPEPIRQHFARCARRLNMGGEEVAALDELTDRLNHPFARIFVSNCKAVLQSQRAAEMFEDIAYQLNTWRVRQSQNRSALAGGKTIGLLLNGLLPVVYVINVRLQPGTQQFLTETSAGRGLVVLVLFGVLLTFGLNKYLAQADW